MQLTIALAVVAGLGVKTLLPSISDARDDEVVPVTPEDDLKAPRTSRTESPTPTSVPGAPRPRPTDARKSPVDEPRPNDPSSDEVIAEESPPAQPTIARPAPRRAPVAKKPKDPLGMDAMLQMVEEDLRKSAEQSRAKGPTKPLFDPND